MIETRAIAFTRLEIVATGIVDAGDVRRAGDALRAALAGGGRATLLVDLSGVEDITVKAFGGDLAGGADAADGGDLAARLGRLERVAVVGDASWVRALTRLQSALPVRLRVRFFDPRELDEARDWLGGGTAEAADGVSHDAPGRSGPARGGPLPGSTSEEARAKAGARAHGGDGERAGLRLLDGDAPNLFVLEIEGRVRREDVEAMAARLDEIESGEPRIRLLGRVISFDGFEPAVLLSPALWRLQREGLARVSRFALLTSVDWLGRLLESSSRLQRVQTRTFAVDDEAGARAWLDAAPDD